MQRAYDDPARSGRSRFRSHRGLTLGAVVAAVVAVVAAMLVLVLPGSGSAAAPVRLAFAEERYGGAGGLSVARSWSISPDGTRLTGELVAIRHSDAAPAELLEVLPASLVASVDAVESDPGIERIVDREPVVVSFAPELPVGAPVTITYELAPPPGPANLGRLQSWAVERARDAERLGNELARLDDALRGAPETLLSLRLDTPVVQFDGPRGSYRLVASGDSTHGGPADARLLDAVRFDSQDQAVATVDDAGVIRPVAPGTTVVNARSGPLVATATVLVVDPAGGGPEVTYRQTESGQVVVTVPPAPPDAPEEVVATSGDARALLVWSAPYDGGAPVEEYEVGRTVATGGGPAAGNIGSIAGGGAPGVTSHLEVTGLGNAEAHQFRVRARNAEGWSGWSPPSAAVTPAAGDMVPPGCRPSAPRSVEAELVPRTRVVVRWQAPVSDGCRIERYVVRSSFGDEVVVGPDETTATLDGLDEATEYRVAVRAEYADAPSQTSSSSAPVITPYGPCPDGTYADVCPPSQPGDPVLLAPDNNLLEVVAARPLDPTVNPDDLGRVVSAEVVPDGAGEGGEPPDPAQGNPRAPAEPTPDPGPVDGPVDPVQPSPAEPTLTPPAGSQPHYQTLPPPEETPPVPTPPTEPSVPTAPQEPPPATRPPAPQNTLPPLPQDAPPVLEQDGPATAQQEGVSDPSGPIPPRSADSGVAPGAGSVVSR